MPRKYENKEVNLGMSQPMSFLNYSKLPPPSQVTGVRRMLAKTRREVTRGG